VSPDGPWAELVSLAEHELALVLDGRWEEVPAASAQRLSAAQALGDPPRAARPHLERLVELQNEIHAGLSIGRAFTLQKNAKIERGQTALRGYSGRSPRPAATAFNGRA
jgi:hypothetical protein